MPYLRSLITPIVTVLFFFIALYVFNFFLGPLPLNTSSNSAADLFTVSATGEADTTAQNASFSVGVTETADTAAEAQNQVNATMSQILTQIKALGITDTDIQTETVQVNPNYNFTTGSQSIDGYTASQNIRVNAPIDIANQALDAAVAQGANVITGISFELDDQDMTELEAKAREDGINKAKEKAQSIADAAGIKLGKIVNVMEFNEGGQPMPLYAERSVSMANDAQKIDLQPGENKVRVNVTLYYETR